jgi:hypothetical protein
MRDLFPGHFKEDDAALKKVWDECIFVFDANILLNFYRYSDSTRKEFLQLLSKIRDRVWLPHRAAEEYLNNRLSVIDQQEKSYDDTINAMSSLRKDLENARQHPFVNKKTMAKVNEVFSLLCNELTDNKGFHTKRISDDEIKESISSIFEKSVGSPYSKEDLEKIISDGEERYRQKIPPGFKDGSKSGNTEVFSEQCRKYGDLIVWYQVIAKSVETNKSVILVTDDKKEDWWEKFKGKTVGPRPELVKEFRDKTGNAFYMYQADRFLELARENLNERVSEAIVEEIREVRRRDKLAYKRMKEMDFVNRGKMKLHHLMEELDHLRHQMMAQEQELSALHEKRSFLEVERDRIREHRHYTLHEGERDMDLEKLLRNFELISEDYDQVRMHLERSKATYSDMQHRMMILERELAHGMKNIEQENAADS